MRNQIRISWRLDRPGLLDLRHQFCKYSDVGLLRSKKSLDFKIREGGSVNGTLSEISSSRRSYKSNVNEFKVEKRLMTRLKERILWIDNQYSVNNIEDN